MGHDLWEYCEPEIMQVHCLPSTLCVHAKNLSFRQLYLPHPFL